MIRMPVSARIPPHWISCVDGNVMVIPMPARSSKTRLLYSVFMYLDTRELRCDCLGFQIHRKCFHVNWLPLACSKRARRKGAQDTQLEAYYSLAPEVLADCQLELYLAYEKHGPVTDRMLSEILGKGRHIITARRNELMDDGLVEDAGRIVDPISNITVHVWGCSGMAAAEA